MRRIAAAVLTLEAVVIALAAPVAIGVSDLSPGLALPLFLGVALAALVTAGLLSRPYGYSLGWVVQVVAVALGVLVPAMFFLGGLFAFLWFMALRLGKEVDAAQARRESDPDLG